MREEKFKYGIVGLPAPELAQDIEWIDAEGNDIPPVQLSQHNGKIKVIYGFQSWCPGCHSLGFPTLQKLIDGLRGHDEFVFFVVQTVFEGAQVNTKEQLIETRKRYGLMIPFGHDIGSEKTGNRSSTMYNYRTGGTPWFIFIDTNDTVVFNDFHVNEYKAIEYLVSIK